MAEIVIRTRQAVSLNGFSARRNKAISRKVGIKHESRYQELCEVKGHSLMADRRGVTH